MITCQGAKGKNLGFSLCLLDFFILIVELKRKQFFTLQKAND